MLLFAVGILIGFALFPILLCLATDLAEAVAVRKERVNRRRLIGERSEFRD